MKNIAIVLTVLVVGLSAFAHEEPEVAEKIKNQERLTRAAIIKADREKAELNKKSAAAVALRAKLEKQFEDNVKNFDPKLDRHIVYREKYRKDLKVSLTTDGHATLECVRKVTKKTDKTVEFINYFMNLHLFPGAGKLSVVHSMEMESSLSDYRTALNADRKAMMKLAINSFHERFRKEVQEKNVLGRHLLFSGPVTATLDKVTLPYASRVGDEGTSPLEIAGKWSTFNGGGKDLSTHRTGADAESTWEEYCN